MGVKSEHLLAILVETGLDNDERIYTTGWLV